MWLRPDRGWGCVLRIRAANPVLGTSGLGIVFIFYMCCVCAVYASEHSVCIYEILGLLTCLILVKGYTCMGVLYKGEQIEGFDTL